MYECEVAKYSIVLILKIVCLVSEYKFCSLLKCQLLCVASIRDTYLRDYEPLLKLCLFPFNLVPEDDCAKLLYKVNLGFSFG